jgi:hypothetical protein
MANPVNISGYGLVATFVASLTYPTGLPITQFTDDADPLLINDVKIGDVAMGLNGDLMGWNKAVPLPVIINVIPGSLDDQNLQILAKANRVQQGQSASQDVISVTILYPDLQPLVFAGGIITDAAFGRTVQASGRQKGKQYGFMFATQA